MDFTWWPTIYEVPGALDNKDSIDNKDPLGSLDWWWMYASFVSPEWNKQEKWEDKEITEQFNNKRDKESNNQQNENIEKELSVFEKNKKNPATPVLERINNDISWVSIWNSDLEKIYDNLWTIDSEKDVISELLDAIDKSNLEEKTHDILSSILTQIWKNSDDRLKESNDWKVELPEEFKWNKLLNNPKYEKVVGLLAKNYISFPEWDSWEPNIEKDIQLSIETTVNKVIGWKQIPNTEGFRYAINEVHSGDLGTQLEALNYIYSWVNTNEWMKWKKSKWTFDKMKWEHVKSKAEYYDFKIKQFESQIKDTIDDVEKNRLELIVEKLKKDKEKDDFQWEVFSWDTKNEAIWDKISEDPFETA